MKQQYVYVVMHLDYSREEPQDSVVPLKVFMFSDPAEECATQENDEASENDFYYVLRTPIGVEE